MKIWNLISSVALKTYDWIDHHFFRSFEAFGGGAYGAIATGTFCVLQSQTMVSDFQEYGFPQMLLVNFFDLGISTFSNMVTAFLWPLLLLKYL